jgi:hypothetical protein
MENYINLPIQKLLEFYDDPSQKDKKHTTAITAVIGESLGTGLLVDYYHHTGCTVRALDKSVTVGTNKGNRLDKWLVVTKQTRTIYYQVEIKNWGAAALGGRRIAPDADPRALKQHKIERWSKEWNGQGFIKVSVQKVLIPMRPPEGARHIEPLICFWDAMHPKGGNSPLFSIPLKNQHFRRVWVFSMSSYLRNLMKLGEAHIQIEAPDILARFGWLNRLIQTTK